MAALGITSSPNFKHYGSNKDASAEMPASYHRVNNAKRYGTRNFQEMGGTWVRMRSRSSPVGDSTRSAKASPSMNSRNVPREDIAQGAAGGRRLRDEN